MATGNASLTLHRVMNVIYMTDAKLLDATFTTVEYSHTPLPGFQGLWGTFAHGINPSFDRRNRRSGLQHVRHLAIGREVVTMYNVQTFTKKG
eukprot:3347032-Pleurochrysis_carterae.AAC.1